MGDGKEGVEINKAVEKSAIDSMLAAASELSSISGNIKSSFETVKQSQTLQAADIDKLKRKVMGTNGDMQGSHEYRMLQVERDIKNCPIKDIRAELDAHRTEVRKEFTLFKSLLLAKKTEELADANAAHKTAEAIAGIKENALIIQVKWIKNLLRRVKWTHPFMWFLYIFFGGSGTVYLNRMHIMASFKSAILALIKLGLQVYKNGGM